MREQNNKTMDIKSKYKEYEIKELTYHLHPESIKSGQEKRRERRKKRKN